MVLDLRLVDQFRIVSEIHVAQLRVAVQPQGLGHEGVELADQEIGQVKGGDFVIMGGKGGVALEERIAMRPAHHLDTQGIATLLQQPTGAAIGIDDKDVVIGGAVFLDGGLDQIRDLFGAVMQDRGQAVQVEMIPAVLPCSAQN